MMDIMDILLSSSSGPPITISASAKMASGLFNSVVSLGRTAMQRFSADFDPFLVRTVNSKEYGTVVTQDRHEMLLFCGPKRLKKDEEVFEVIVLAVKNDTAFW